MNLKNILTGLACLGFMTASAQNIVPAEKNQYNDEKAPQDPCYNPNVLAFAPLQFTENGIAGFSFSLEHAIDERSIVAFYIPAIVEFNLSNTQNTQNTNKNSDPMFYIMPGIKFYPTGAFSPITKYAIGPSLVIADGQKTISDYNYYGGGGYEVQNHFLIGMMVNQSININPTPWLYLGCEFGLGFTYVDKIGGVNQGVQTLTNFNFKIGYRF